MAYRKLYGVYDIKLQVGIWKFKLLDLQTTKMNVQWSLLARIKCDASTKLSHLISLANGEDVTNVRLEEIILWFYFWRATLLPHNVTQKFKSWNTSDLDINKWCLDQSQGSKFRVTLYHIKSTRLILEIF